jgi:DNA-binding PadR family transcriptional regulator
MGKTVNLVGPIQELVLLSVESLCIATQQEIVEFVTTRTEGRIRRGVARDCLMQLTAQGYILRSKPYEEEDDLDDYYLLSDLGETTLNEITGLRRCVRVQVQKDGTIVPLTELLEIAD